MILHTKYASRLILGSDRAFKTLQIICWPPPSGKQKIKVSDMGIETERKAETGRFKHAEMEVEPEVLTERDMERQVYLTLQETATVFMFSMPCKSGRFVLQG